MNKVKIIHEASIGSLETSINAFLSKLAQGNTITDIKFIETGAPSNQPHNGPTLRFAALIHYYETQDQKAY